MRRSKGMTFVEVMSAMLVTLIIGGSSALFLKSGLDMERANTLHASNQQSMRAPLMELIPLIERARKLEVLTALPDKDTLEEGEMVAYAADPRNSTKLNGGQNNLYLRTRSGDRLLPGFSHIAAVTFEKIVGLNPDDGVNDVRNQAVRVNLAAKNEGTNLVYSTDIRPLYRVDSASPKGVLVEGAASGAFLKIEAGNSVVLYPFITRAKAAIGGGGNFGRQYIPAAMTLAQSMRVVGNFLVLAGSPTTEFECEWRLSDKDVGRNEAMTNYTVIGKNFLSANAYYTTRYEDRFREAKTPIDAITASDIRLNDTNQKLLLPTGTTAKKPKTYDDSLVDDDILQLHADMKKKWLVFAVRPKGGGSWTHTEAYLITRNPVQESLFFKDLKGDVESDKKNGETKTLFDGIQNAGVNLAQTEQHGEEEVYLELSGRGVDGRPFLSKELVDSINPNKYFNGKREQTFCLENYTLWMDAFVGAGSTSGWTFLLNANVVKNQVPKPATSANKRPGDQAYGYGFQFDPGMDSAGAGANNIPGNRLYFLQKSLNKTIENTQGVIIRRFVGSTNTVPEGVASVRRWMQKTTNPQQEGPGKSFSGDARYYLWSDVAYKGGPRPIPDAHEIEGKYGINYGDSFAVEGNSVSSMRGKRYVTQINLLTQTKKVAGKTVPERIFCRVRVYDEHREYNERLEEWLFPAGTGRSKDMWFGWAANGQPLAWGLPVNQPVSLAPGVTFEQGDVAYHLKDMANELINNYDNSGYKGYAIGRSWGLRIWGGNPILAKVHFIDITEGFPLDYELPWKKSNGQPLRVKEAMGEWDSEKPYELK